MRNEQLKLDKNKIIKDSGLRVNANGSIRVSRAVFYSRPDVKKVMAKMQDSTAYPKK
jgi:hypothetical protein